MRPTGAESPGRRPTSVVHAEWGPGTVSAVEADLVTVRFDERG